MAFSPGTRLGPYEIHSLRGKGGMGEVYRAYDVRLDRTVAVKVLPALLASDEDFRQRFEREARAVAALSHPHICTLYDVGEAPDPDAQVAEPVRFLVMEYLEGDTLDERLRKKTLSLDQTLRIAIQIADALDKAHRRGIVHRDLKPGNIMLTAGGPGSTGSPQAKLLDFGLAKMRPAGAVGGMTVAATVSAPLTGRGTILGTLHYMAPEQVEGKDADHRSDLFAFGTIVYEMITGKKAFEGASAASVMAAILEREPPAMSALQPVSPPLLDHVVKRCLAKDPDERWQSAGDVMRELTWIAEAGAQTSATPNRDPRGRRRERIAWMTAVAVLTAIAVLAVVAARRPPVLEPELRVELATPPTFDPFSLAISPDGRKVVFVATSEGRSQLWLRSLDAVSVQPLKGTENSQLPFWSPDGQSIGFAASGQLKRIDLENGAVRRLANAPLFLGGTWGRDGTILFVPSATSPVFRVSDSSGEPAVVTSTTGQQSHHFPHMLPDGRHFLYYVAGSPEVRGVYVAQIDGTATRRLLDADSAAVYLPSGHLLFVRQGALVAQAFDATRQELAGQPARVVEQITTGPFAGATLVALSVSATGRIIYRTGSPHPARFQLAWRDRSGTKIEPLSDQLPVALNPALSPDEQRVAMFAGGDIWILELRNRNLRKFTLDPGMDFAGIFSPTGDHITFSSNRKGVFDLFRKPVTGAGEEERLLTTPQDKTPTDWSRDGKFLLYRVEDPKTSFDIWVLSAADRRAFPVVQTGNEERDAQFSPDGRWIAYQSNESGRFEIWVRPFPGSDPKAGVRWQVSTAGGAHVRWRADGKELFFLGLEGRLMAVPINVASDGQAIEAGKPEPLFDTGALPFGGGTAMQRYMVSRDGQRFLMSTVPTQPTTTPITLILNWKPQP